MLPENGGESTATNKNSGNWKYF